MKAARIGEFEEVILLIVGILGEEAYTYRITMEYKTQTGRSATIGAVHSTLDRLENKGLLDSAMGKSTPERGGRRKRVFRITASGRRVLKNSRDFKMTLWSQYPAFANA